MADRRDAVTELYLLRHAHAGDASTWDGPDAVRPLSPKGERQSERLGRFLASAGFRPDAILTSPKTRALQTAELVAAALDVKVRIDERLGEALDLVTLEAILTEAGDPSRPVLVGHDPDFSELLESIAGARQLPMRKGALARLDTLRPLSPGSGMLRWLVPPDFFQGG